MHGSLSRVHHCTILVQMHKRKITPRIRASLTTRRLGFKLESRHLLTGVYLQASLENTDSLEPASGIRAIGGALEHSWKLSFLS